ncbi:hypothetical protein [Streptomyces sp. NPDC127084]|uniref:hypothetical protein n=1 Tax=Streptomyces sp. NPDC127084 TaxID=3347133 RepID=UPI00365F2982
MSGGYQFDREALDQITKGIDLAMDELKELGFDIEANLGRGFDELELAGLEVGDDALTRTFAAFCENWGWGVRTLMQDANEFARRLGLSAGIYHEQEQYASDTLKNAWTAATGNPHLTQEEINGRSWGDTFKDNNLSHIQNADFSAESGRAGLEQAEQAWAQAGEDVRTSTVTPGALFEDDTEWQWDGPPEQQAGPGAGGGER